MGLLSRQVPLAVGGAVGRARPGSPPHHSISSVGPGDEPRKEGPGLDE